MCAYVQYTMMSLQNELFCATLQTFSYTRNTRKILMHKTYPFYSCAEKLKNQNLMGWLNQVQ